MARRRWQLFNHVSMLHVVADPRGEWGVFEDGSRRPLSVHRSATEAEFVAWDHAKDRGSERIVVHDRYGRTREAVGASAAAQRCSGLG